ncbi:ferredoxin [Sistotremastrum niveocremeum HHB9708]|uniref:Ferredoxin n=1 Tax=Sistotremastrum niveocremeum HHB9708 TaxID=1314777 RepID=A0A164Y6A2_9AGAM|nr:ferredoxin [Sistotremastrum niveocremeum HHB9708]
MSSAECRRSVRTVASICSAHFQSWPSPSNPSPLLRPTNRLGSLATWERATPRRSFHSSPPTRHNEVKRPEPGSGITVHFKDAKGTLLKTVEANEGDSILDIAHEYDIDLEAGACEGSVACSTCHVILPPEYYDLLPEPEDDENDMLDMAFGLTDTSRLGCQVKLTKELDGITATLPSATRNMFVDGKRTVVSF